MRYLYSKNLKQPQRGPTPEKHKVHDEYVMPNDSWEGMLEAIEGSANINPAWKRDYALIFIACALGLRRGEACILRRENFRDLEKHDVIHCPTLKQSEKIPFVCGHDQCGRRCRVKAASSGQPHKCARCGKTSTVPNPRKPVDTSIPEKDLDIIEGATVGFILDYLDGMRPDQQWLFEGRKGYHMSTSHVNRIFNTYAAAAGLSPKISFHSLRHNRGVRTYTTSSNDLVAVKNALRQKNITTAQIYADLDQERKDELRKALERKAFDPLKKRKKSQETR